MNRIDRTFKKLKKEGKKALIIYLTAGYPSLKATEEMVIEFEKNGADIIEIGIPFSDPIADGPTIQKSSEQSLKRGTTLNKIFKIVKMIRRKSDIPIIFMTYFNPVYNRGLFRFISDSLKCGADGVVIPDLPPEESKEIIKLAASKKFHLIFLASPTTTAERLKMIADKSKGFIYYVSLTGVTGERAHIPLDIKENIKKITHLSKKPVCVGFGVSNKKQAEKIASISDGVIVGSAVINTIKKSKSKRTVGKFVASLADAVHNI